MVTFNPSSKSDSPLAAYELDWSDPKSMDDSELVDFVTRQYRSAKDRRFGWESRAIEQLAWVEGDQHLKWSDQKKELENYFAQLNEGVPFEKRHPVQINLLKSIVFQKIAMLLGRPATLVGIALSSDDDDVASASVQTKLLQFMWHTGPESIRGKLIRAFFEMFSTGLVFIHPVWDPFYGPPESFGPDLQSAAGLAEGIDKVERQKLIAAYRDRIAETYGKPADEIDFDDGGGVRLPPGRVTWEFPTGFDISEPEYATTIDQCDWLIHTQWRSMEYLRARYPESVVEEIKPDSSSAEYLNSFRGFYGSYAERTGEKSSQGPAELVQVHTLWRPKAPPWAPEGAMIVVADKTLLHKSGHPYPHGQLPFVKLQEQPSRWFRPGSTIHDLMSLQQARNRSRSQLAAAIHMAVAPKIIAEEGAHVPDDAFDSNSNTISVADGAIADRKIMPWPGVRIPRELFTIDELYRRDMEDVAGIHSSTSGRGESKQQSGRHAAILVQRDSRGGLVTRELVETAIAAAANQSMWLWFKYVTTERTLQITGSGSSVDVLAFKGEDLFAKKRRGREPAPTDFNVRVRLGSDNEFEQILERIQLLTSLGYWSPERSEDRIKVERLLAEGVNTEFDPDERQRLDARHEHASFITGERVETNLGDHDAIHIAEHDEWTTTEEFRRETARDKRIKVFLRVHRQEHLDQLYNKPAMAAVAQKRAELRAKATLGNVSEILDLAMQLTPETQESVLKLLTEAAKPAAELQAAAGLSPTAGVPPGLSPTAGASPSPTAGLQPAAAQTAAAAAPLGPAGNGPVTAVAR
ncbi:MAG: hypothetical protein IID32_00700 [Planctomycetes bacterium]|nr:hypothetical protein [Planctomycetota bacterium]